MDSIADKTSLVEFFKKHRVVVLFLVLGILLLAIPDGTQKQTAEPAAVHTEKAGLEDSLVHILSQISGAGAVEVLLTQSAGERIAYQTNDDSTGTDIRRSTVLITGADREEKGLVRQVLPPVYQGAIVVCQGADSAQIRLAIVEAVMCATGLTSDRISVLKMK